LLRAQSFIIALLFFSAVASAKTENMKPFAQADTSSPQATLQTFLGAVEQNFTNDKKSFLSYIASDRLYPNAEEKRLTAENEQPFLRGLETMDLSGLPSGFIDALAVEKIVLLADVLSRVDIPPINDVPTHEAMKSLGETSWRIPNTRIDIPNGTLVNSVVDNLGVRGKRLQRFSVQISYDMPHETMELFLDGVRAIISNHPMTDKDVYHIYLNKLGDNGLEVLLYFYLRVTDYGSELRELEGVLLKILNLAEGLGVTFIELPRTDDSSHSEKKELNPATVSTAS